MVDESIFTDEENKSIEEEPVTDIQQEKSDDIGSMIRQVRKIDNVKYFFDPSGNSPDNTIKSLNTFQQKIILITGGKDENMSYDPLGEILVKKVKHLILIGQTSGLIEMGLIRKLVGKNQGIDIRITRCNTLKQAVDCAYLSSKPGDSVLLSPASSCISDEKNYHELMELYSKYIDAL